jgi:hypothetical protein
VDQIQLTLGHISNKFLSVGDQEDHVKTYIDLLHFKCLRSVDLSITFFLSVQSIINVPTKPLVPLSYRARRGTQVLRPQTHYGGGLGVNSEPGEHSGRVSSFPHNLDGRAERSTRQAVSGGGGDSGEEGCEGRSRGVVDFDDAHAGTSAPSASTSHSTTTTVSLGFHCPPPIICSSF